MLAPGIAGRIGRYSLNRTAPRTSADRESANGTAGLSLIGGADLSADLGLGRLSAGVGGVAVLALVAFYLWTRQHQA